MNKRNIVITISVTALCLFILLVSLYLINYSKEKNRQEIAKKAAVIVENNRLSWSLQSQTGLAKSAVEEYVLQSDVESTKSREKRLEKYFSAESPIYQYGNTNLVSPVTKSVGVTGKIDYCEEQEGGDLCLLVQTSLTLSSPAGNTTTDQTYWVTIQKDGDNFKAYDIGAQE